MAVPIEPPPVTGKDPDLLRVLYGWFQALLDLQQPQGPTAVYAVAEADLPPAADWPNCVVPVSDLDILAHSNGSDWIREDTGAAI